MKSRLFIVVIFLYLFIETAFSVKIEQVPYSIVYTRNSVLTESLPESAIRYAGTRPRYSTCSGVAWFNADTKLFAVNMQGSFLDFYQVTPKKNCVKLVTRFTNRDGLDLSRPENVAISKDQKLLAISNMTTGETHIYKTDKKKGIIPTPIKTIKGSQTHGVSFSPTGQYLVSSRLDSMGVCIYEISGQPILIASLGLPFYPLKPKTASFSLDGRYLVVGYSSQLSEVPIESRAIVVVYEFDRSLGSINPDPVCYSEKASSIETLAFHPDYFSFFTTDQVNDRVYGHVFDPVTGQIGASWIALEKGDSYLNMPHGLSFASSGKFLAVSNYGDDKITVYRVEK